MIRSVPTSSTVNTNAGAALGGRALRALAPAAQEFGAPVRHARLWSGMVWVYVCLCVVLISSGHCPLVGQPAV